MTAGYAQMTNWIDQDITLGGQAAVPSVAYTDAWRYSGKADVVSLGTSFAWTERLTLIGQFEYVHGVNTYATPPSPPSPPNPAGVDFSDLPGYSAVSIETYRVAAGFDYLLRAGMSTFVRYNFYDFSDLAQGVYTGQSHMVLAGLTGTF